MWLLRLRLLGCTLKRVFLQLYCPLRRRREGLSPDHWLLLALVRPSVAVLVALFACVLARGQTAQFVAGGAVAITIAAAAYALVSVQASFFGPTANDADQALIAVRDRQEALRTEIGVPTPHCVGVRNKSVVKGPAELAAGNRGETNKRSS